MRYAEVQCGDCRLILPANQMYKVTDRVKSGESVAPVTRFSTSGSPYRDTETTIHYAHRAKLVCPDCKRRRFRNAVLKGVVTILAIGALFVYGAISKRDQSAAPKNLFDGVNAAATETPGMTDGADAETAADNIDTAPTDERDVRIRDDKPTETANEPAAEPGPEVADAIRAATVEALAQVKPVRWKMDDYRGWVTVSELQVGSANECRNVSATIGLKEQDENEHQASSPMIWCKSDSGEWAPK